MHKFCFSVLGILIFSFTNAQKNIQLLAHLPYPQGVSCSNVGGYVDSTGREYALVGTSEGLSIVDISVPTAPFERFFVPGATGQGGFWREMREYKGYAYVTTEETSGLIVADLRELPDTVVYHQINPGGITTSHTIFIDEQGVAYVNGTNKDMVLLNLNVNGWNPPVMGRYTNYYVHDSYVRNDTAWLSCINDGFTIAIDASNKSDLDNPARVLAQWNTPLNFSHNSWLSDDGKYLFTTDEKPASHVTCYDVSDLNNVTETDRTEVLPRDSTIIHNTYFLNNYCISSAYTYGVTIHDVNRKNNLVEVGSFDTSPNYDGDGFHGAWGVWPYLPSGNLVVTDIETGLWILKPTYTRAGYVEGTVRDAVCNTLLNNVQIEILQTPYKENTNLLGRYSFGTPDSGTYTIRYSKPGYINFDTTGVVLKNGQLTVINVSLVPDSTASIVIKAVDDITGAPLPFVRVLVQTASGNTYTEAATNNNGEISICDFLQGSYVFYAGRWGKQTARVSKAITGPDTVIIPVKNGYYDDFIMDYGWTIASTAPRGTWERGLPQGTTFQGDDSNPGEDVGTDFGKDCYVTGNGGGAAGEDDVDDGYTVLRSPLFNLTTYNDPYISYYLWFFNGGGQGTAPNDSFIITLSNGFDTVVLDKITPSSTQSQWIYRKHRVKDITFPAINMRLECKAIDANPGHLVEAAIDVFMVEDSASTDTAVSVKDVAEGFVRVFPNPFTNYINVWSATAGQLKGTLFTMLGEKVQEWEWNTTTTALPINTALSKGVYVLQLSENGRAIKNVRLLKTE